MKRTVLLFTFIFMIAGCGYTTRSAVSMTYKTIYIPPFENKIDVTRDSDVGNKYKVFKPNLETDVTRAVINKFLFDGNLKPVKQDTADLTLRGQVVEFRRNPVRYDINDEVEEYRLDLVVNLSLWDRKADKLLWEENGFVGYSNYFVSGPTAISETQAINDALIDLSRRVVERAVDQW